MTRASVPASVRDGDDPNPSSLAAMGILAGCVICACLLLVIALAPGSDPVAAGGSELKTGREDATALRVDERAQASEPAKAATTGEQPRHQGNAAKPRDKKRDNKPASSKYKNAYVESVPGKAPKMIEMQ